MNILKEMVLSVYSYGSYKQFLQNKKSKVFGFGAMLVLIYFVIVMLVPGLVSFFAPSGAMHIIVGGVKSIPDFEIRNGKLRVDDVVEIDDDDGTYIYINTNPKFVFYDADEMEPYLYEYTSALLMDSEKMIMKTIGGQMQELYFSNLGMDVDKNDLLRLLPMVYVGFAFVMLFMYIWITALFFFGVLFIALIGMIVASAMKYQLTFGQLYLLGIYSRTLPLIIKAIVRFLPFNIPYFWVINFGLSVLILFLTIRKMKEEKPPQNVGYNI